MSAEKENGLRFGPLCARTVHICVDMQRMFAEDTPWKTPWMPLVLPMVERIAGDHPSETIFTRFLPANQPGDGQGAWRRYWRRWPEMTMAKLKPGMIDLSPNLARLTPPGVVIDKRVYSPWFEPALDNELRRRRADTLVVTGAETDVCVLSTVLGALDRGYRIIVVTDGVCSSADETHEASLTLYHDRFGQQVETVDTETVLHAWAAEKT